MELMLRIHPRQRTRAQATALPHGVNASGPGANVMWQGAAVAATDLLPQELVAVAELVVEELEKVRCDPNHEKHANLHRVDADRALQQGKLPVRTSYASEELSKPQYDWL